MTVAVLTELKLRDIFAFWIHIESLSFKMNFRRMKVWRLLFDIENADKCMPETRLQQNCRLENNEIRLLRFQHAFNLCSTVCPCLLLPALIFHQFFFQFCIKKITQFTLVLSPANAATMNFIFQMEDTVIFQAAHIYYLPIQMQLASYARSMRREKFCALHYNLLSDCSVVTRKPSRVKKAIFYSASHCQLSW